MPSLKTGPLESRKVTLALPEIEPQPGVEYWLNLSFRLADNAAWADLGHEVAWEQFKLDVGEDAPELDVQTMASLALRHDGDDMTVSGDGFTVRFDAATGTIASWMVDGNELIRSGPRPNFWRAPTDNDRGNGWPERCAPWKAATANWKVTASSVSQPVPARNRGAV